MLLSEDLSLSSQQLIERETQHTSPAPSDAVKFSTLSAKWMRETFHFLSHPVVFFFFFLSSLIFKDSKLAAKIFFLL
jgi:hypothetical protein